MTKSSLVRISYPGTNWENITILEGQLLKNHNQVLSSVPYTDQWKLVSPLLISQESVTAKVFSVYGLTIKESSLEIFLNENLKSHSFQSSHFSILNQKYKNLVQRDRCSLIFIGASFAIVNTWIWGLEHYFTSLFYTCSVLHQSVSYQQWRDSIISSHTCASIQIL